MPKNCTVLYKHKGVEVIFDDRKERPGVMFADMELIDCPHMVVIGEKNLANGEIEYKIVAPVKNK